MTDDEAWERRIEQQLKIVPGLDVAWVLLKARQNDLDCGSPEYNQLGLAMSDIRRISRQKHNPYCVTP